jgi:hypothetical protein
MKAATQSQGSAALKMKPLGSEDETAWDAFVDSHERGSIYYLAIWRKPDSSMTQALLPLTTTAMVFQMRALFLTT